MQWPWAVQLAGSHLHVLQRVHWRRLFDVSALRVRVQDQADGIAGVDNGTTLAEALNRMRPYNGGCARASRNVSRARRERKSCPNNCNFHAVNGGQPCSHEGSWREPVLDQYTYSNVWDAMMYGCVRRRLLRPRLQFRDCPTGDDPMTGDVDDPAGAALRKAASCSASGGTHLVPRTDDRGHQLPRVGCGISGGRLRRYRRS